MPAVHPLFDDSAAPQSRPSRPILDPQLLDEAYRLAVCLVHDEQRAGLLCARAMRGLGVRRAGVSASLVRWSLLRRVLGEGRAEHPRPLGGAARRRPFPELALLSLPQREVVALQLACELSIGECSMLLRISEVAVQELRRAGRRVLAAAARVDASRGDAAG